MDFNQPLLSICIPTYNRCKILEENIIKIISLSEFDDEVQLIINDNASTDDTPAVVKKIINENKNKNIKYYRNKENIKDLNFYYALKNGDGLYCKLLNDYVCPSNTSLLQMKEAVKKYKTEKEIYLILCLNYYAEKIERDVICKDANDVVLNLHNKLTWISNFGCFRYQIKSLEEYLQYKQSLLLQLYWHINLAKDVKKIIICPITQWNALPMQNSMRKSVYNFFKVHVANYYDIINKYLNLGKGGLKKDKSFLLSDFVGKKAVDYLILKRECPFELTGSWNILWRYFYNVPYFYIFIPKEIISRFILKARHIIGF